MLIRHPQIKAEPNPSREDASNQALEQLEAKLNQGSADECIELLSGWPRLSPGLREQMLQRMLVDSDVRLQQVFMNHLVADLCHQELVFLLDQLNTDQASLRNQIIDGLSQVDQQKQQDLLLPELQRRLQHGDRDTRILSLNLITWLENPSFLPSVEALIEQEEDVNVCMTALDALPALGADPDNACLSLLEKRFDGEAYVRFAVDTTRKELAALKAKNAQRGEEL